MKTKGHIKKIESIKKELNKKYIRDQEIWVEELVLLIEKVLNVGEVSSKSYIKDLWRRGIIIYIGHNRYKLG